MGMPKYEMSNKNETPVRVDVGIDDGDVNIYINNVFVGWLDEGGYFALCELADDDAEQLTENGIQVSGNHVEVANYL
jgi:hypothetical protein